MFSLIDIVLTKYYFGLLVPLLSEKPVIAPIFHADFMTYHKALLTVIMLFLITLNSYLLQLFTIYTVVLEPAYITLTRTELVSADERELSSLQPHSNGYLTIYWLCVAILMSFDYLFYSNILALFRIIFLCLLWSNSIVRAELFKFLSSKLHVD